MGLADHWRQFRSAEPGGRFRDHHERWRDRHLAVKLALVAVGVVLVAAGVVMLFLPGPGIVAIVLGLALVATGSRPLSDALDRVEHRVSAWRARRRPSEKKVHTEKQASMSTRRSS